MTGRPPRFARWLMLATVPRALQREVLADVDERYHRLARDVGPRAARRWYRRQAGRTIAPRIALALRVRHLWGSQPRPPRPEAYRSRRELTMAKDLIVALRSLARSPGYATAAIGILGLGIGGTTAVFSALNAILIRPLPYAAPDDLAILWTVNTQQNLPDGTSPLNLHDWRERNRSFSALAAYIRPSFTTYTVTGLESPERVHVGRVTWNFFDVIGVDPIVGRPFTPADLDGASRVAVLSASYAEQRFGTRDTAVGQSLRLDGDLHVVIGVVPSSVELPYPATMMWTLFDDRVNGVSPRMRSADFLVVLGRLRANVTFADAQRDMTAIAGALTREYPATNATLGVSVHSLLTEITGERLPQVLWMTLAAAMLVLLIAATNVAHLTLARGSQRRRELAIRSALGARRTRLIHQLAVESLTVAFAAGGIGIAIAAVAIRGLVAMGPADIPRLQDAHLNFPVLLLALGLSVVIGPVIGLVPALMTSRTDPADALREGGRGTSATQRRLRRGFVVAEVAMAVILLAEGGLLIRSVRNVWSLDPGFDAESVLVAQIDIDESGYPDASQRFQFFREVLERVRALPGTERAGFISDFFIERFPDQRITIEGKPGPAPDDPQPRLTTDWIFPGFFDAVGAPLLSGRDLRWTDIGEEAAQVAIINRAMAEAFWPGESPVGKRYTASTAPEPTWTTVVGVVPNLRRSSLEETPYPQAFLAKQIPTFVGFDLAVRTSRNPASMVGPIRQVVHDIDPSVPLSNTTTAWERLGATVAQRQLQTWLLGLFSGLATLIAAIGLYALVQEFVVARRREIGIRVALGATVAQVYRLVLREGMALAATGLLLGMAGALAAARITASMLFEVDVSDPLTLGAVGVLLLGVAGVASILPAWQASRVPPAETLIAD